MESRKFTAGEFRLLSGLALIFFASVLQLAMFNVAIPQIRGEFDLPADTTSWFDIVFTVPYILLMPFYGQVGDLLGKRGMLVAGAAVFTSGCLMCLFSVNIPILIAGRIVQGIGAAAITPLCLSIITGYVNVDRRGKAIGTWNSFGPIAGIIGPAAAGVLIDVFGWRSVFIPSAVAVAVSLPILFRLLPKDTDTSETSGVLRSYDWPGFLLFSLCLTSFVLYVSSRAVSGRAPLTDWRFLLPSVAGVIVFLLRERRASNPFVELPLLRNKNFSLAAVCVGVRMFLLKGMIFLIPLFVTEVFGFPPTKTGLLVACHSASLLLTMRIGGTITDKLSNRVPVIIGLAIQTAGFVILPLLPGATGIALIVIALILNGSGAGLSIAALHHTALHGVAADRAGAAAGLYSMIRFIGSLFGTAVIGVVLEQAIGTFTNLTAAYSRSFVVLAVTGGAAVVLSLFLKEVRRS